jgi:hypothetical protein
MGSRTPQPSPWVEERLNDLREYSFASAFCATYSS